MLNQLQIQAPSQLFLDTDSCSAVSNREGHFRPEQKLPPLSMSVLCF
jgi:hypothetical protein